MSNFIAKMQILIRENRKLKAENAKLKEDSENQTNEAEDEIIKLKEHLKHIDTCLSIMAHTMTDEGIKDLPNLADELRKYIEQALKD